MLPYLFAGCIGAALAFRNRPRTVHIVREILGAKTGLTYRAEDFPQAGFLVVHGPNKTIVSLQRKKTGGWIFLRGKGDAHMIDAIRDDFFCKE